MSGYRPLYTISEQKAIVAYLLDLKTSGLSITGNVIWQKMEKDVNIQRSWQSLKEHYRRKVQNCLTNKQIFPKLTAEDIKYLKGIKAEVHTNNATYIPIENDTRKRTLNNPSSNMNQIFDSEETFFEPAPTTLQNQPAKKVATHHVHDIPPVESEVKSTALSLRTNDLKQSSVSLKSQETAINTSTLKEHVTSCLNCLRDMEGITKLIRLTKCSHCKTVFKLEFENNILTRVHRNDYVPIS